MFQNFASSPAALLTGALIGLAGSATGQSAPSPSDWHQTPLAIRNAGTDNAIACQFLMAHWFELQFGPIAPGAEQTVALLVRPETGDVAIMNSVGDRMRLERLACGVAGANRDDWAEPPVDWLRQRVTAASLTCDSSDPSLTSEELSCRFGAP